MSFVLTTPEVFVASLVNFQKTQKVYNESEPAHPLPRYWPRSRLLLVMHDINNPSLCFMHLSSFDVLESARNTVRRARVTSHALSQLQSYRGVHSRE
ncbi:hypothetical protein J1614_001439 [Plenodomus biglobosus]|nr:hypothetical protein J1614_001439 [Plenodomus biglobosus]